MAVGSRRRLDLLLVERGLAPTRAKAQALIMAGRVRVGGERVDKAGTPVDAGVEVAVDADGPAYVGRGGHKLAGSLDALGVDPAGAVCLDVGASTGGFTDCLLQRGARAVYAVDVGRAQLHERLAADPRVQVFDRTNARDLDPAGLPSLADLAVVDVSFISLALVLPAVARCVRQGGTIVAMVKPQFEVGRAEVGKGGVVRDPAKIRVAILKVIEAGRALGLEVLGEAPSPLKGPKGNQEIFVRFAVPAREGD